MSYGPYGYRERTISDYVDWCRHARYLQGAGDFCSVCRKPIRGRAKLVALDAREPYEDRPFAFWEVRYVRPFVEVQPREMKFVATTEAQQPVMIRAKYIYVHCGPPAPRPELPSPDDLLNAALGIDLGYA
jgi:hypothetical protein